MIQKCNECNGELKKDEFRTVYKCIWCGKEFYFKEDFTGGV